MVLENVVVNSIQLTSWKFWHAKRARTILARSLDLHSVTRPIGTKKTKIDCCHSNLIRQRVFWEFRNTGMAGAQQELKCSYCHRFTDEKRCPSCGSECRKRKGKELVNDALSWPSRKKTVNPKVPNQLHSLANKCPKWEDKIHALCLCDCLTIA